MIESAFRVDDRVLYRPVHEMNPRPGRVAVATSTAGTYLVLLDGDTKYTRAREHELTHERKVCVAQRS
jgi:hypothetical protein